MRIISLIVVLFAVLGFAAEKHGVVFPITEIPQQYTTEDNYYDASTPQEVRFSYTAPKTGMCTVTTSYPIYVSSGVHRDFRFYGTDNSFLKYKDIEYCSDSLNYEFTCVAGKTYYFSIIAWFSQNPSCIFNIKASVEAGDISVVSIKGESKADTVPRNAWFEIKAPANEGYHFAGWKIESGTGKLGVSNFFRTSFFPTSETVELSYSIVSGKVYELSDSFVSYPYDSSASVGGDYWYGIRMTYKASEDGIYALITKSENSQDYYGEYGEPNYHHKVRYYGNDDTFTSKLSEERHSALGSNSIFLLTAGEQYYFMLDQDSISRFGEPISAKMVRTYKVNADTVGTGFAYVGNGKRNYDSTYAANDTVPLNAIWGADSDFEKWEKVSGSCTILDSTKAQTGVIIKSDCKVRAFFKPGPVYPITQKEQRYSLFKKNNSDSRYQSISFSLVVPNDGWYALNYKSDGARWSDVSCYKDEKMKNDELLNSLDDSFSDTLFLLANDSVFCSVMHLLLDPEVSFSLNYEKLPEASLTVESLSPECSTATPTRKIVKGTIATIEAFGRKGYRPDGWTFVSGSHRFSDSSAYALRDTIDSDTKLLFGCKEASLVDAIIDATDEFKYYKPYQDFIEISPSEGIRFRYEAPAAGLYAIDHISNRNYNVRVEYYGSDYTFTKSQGGLSSDKKGRLYVKAESAGDKFYFSVGSLYLSPQYWDDSIAVAVLPAGTVEIQDAEKDVHGLTNAYWKNLDTLVLGDSIELEVLLDSGEHFVNWELVSGKGHFLDRSDVATSFVLEESAVIKPNTSRPPLYEFTALYKGYTYRDDGSCWGWGCIFRNSTKDYGTYGVRFVLEPTADGMYAVQLKSKDKPGSEPLLLDYGADSTFYTVLEQSHKCSPGIACKLAFNATAGERHYFMVIPNFYDSNTSYSDSVWVKASKTISFRVDSSSVGYAYSGYSGGWYNSYSASNSTYTVGDTAYIQAIVMNLNYDFVRWNVSAGSCKIDKPTVKNTYVVLDGDCSIGMEFALKTIYPITEVATKYMLLDNYERLSYSYDYNEKMIGKNGVRFSFRAPVSGKYSFAFCSQDHALNVLRYGKGDFERCNESFYVSGNEKNLDVGLCRYQLFDQLSLSTGDSVYYIVQGRDAFRDSSAAFSINYLLSTISVDLTTDGNGSVSPDSGFVDAWIWNYYPIAATAKSGYRFDKWSFVSGKGGFIDSLDRNAYFYATENSSIKALFKKGSVYELTSKKTTYNFQKHYYEDRSPNVIRYRWTPTDTNYYWLVFDSVKGTCVEYGNDSLFKTPDSTIVLNGKTYVRIKGTPGEKQYFMVTDSEKSQSRNIDFIAQIIAPSVLLVESKHGDVIPLGNIYMIPESDTVVSADPYGGYAFDSWTKVVGSANISESTSATTRVKIESDSCVIRANYVRDSTAIPELSITSLDLDKYPNVCVQASVIDKNNRKPIVDMDSSNFELQMNNEFLPLQVTEIRNAYILCFQSPDVIKDRDTRTVVVGSKFNNKTSLDAVSWNEDFLKTKINLTEPTWNLVGVEQKENSSLEISVYVTSKDSVKSVSLLMRTSSLTNKSFKPYIMTHVKDSLWTYTVPASMVTYPGIDFYVLVADSLDLYGKSPMVPNPAKQPYTIPIRNKVPVVALDSLKCIDMRSGDGKLRFAISDKDNVHSATIYYRDSLAAHFNEKEMSKNSEFWETSIPADAFSSGMGEVYVYAIDGVGASVRWHKKDNVTIPVCWRKRDVPDVADTLTIVNVDSANASIGRTTKILGLTVKTEDFSEAVDTVNVKVSCLVSGDVENKIVLVEKENGIFVNRDTLFKNEHSPKSDDGKISCAYRDTLVAEYKDSLFGTYTRDTVFIQDSVAFSYRFLEKEKDKDLDSVETEENADFRIRVTTLSKSIHNVDTLNLLLFTDGNDSLWVKAVETGSYTSTFEYKGAFHFVENKSELKKSELDGMFDTETSHNRIKIQAWINGDKTPQSKLDSLIVFSNYVPGDYAEIYDSDLDGRADSVRLHFVSPLKNDLEGVDTLYWNKAGEDWRSVPKKALRGVKGRSWFEAKWDDPFEYGLTAVDASKKPYLKLTEMKDGFSQKMKIMDKVGAVPVKAVKYPGNLSDDAFTEKSARIPPDTLIVTMSESIYKKDNDKSWNNLLVYVPDCKDSLEYALGIDNLVENDSAGVVWTFTLKNHVLKTEDCIRTNPKSSFADAEGNSMGRGGVKVSGSDGESYLNEVMPVPAVSGIGQNVEWIAPGEDEWSTLPDSLATIRVATVLPYTAHVTIYDGLANVVTTFEQKFGENGEMTQKSRRNSENYAKTGFLVWNKRSNKQRSVGSGVYIWRILFKFNDGHSELRFVKMGVKRKK